MKNGAAIGWRALPRLLRPSLLYGERSVRAPGCSLFVLHVDGGSSNVDEAELLSLTGPVYNIEGYGIRFVSSPSHADVMLLTGPLTRNMLEPTLSAFAVLPEPKTVVTVGDWAVSDQADRHRHGRATRSLLAEAFASSYALVDLPETIICAIVAQAAGDPPEPEAIIEALLLAAAHRKVKRSRGRQAGS